MDDVVGTVLGEPGNRYAVEAELAAGGFGQVFRARREDGSAAAIKVLHGFLVDDPRVVRRFHREVLAVRRVRHPGVVEIFDLGELPDGRPYFAMELLVGEDLRRHLASRGALSPAEAMAILSPLCAALDAAHRRGVVHRDVKPSNVFLSDRVVLLDFGIAKLIEDTGPALTASRHSVGTPAAMAPEQIRGGVVDGRADVYALGVLLYQMLAGAPPFAAERTVALQRMHLRQPPPPLGERISAPPGLDAVVQRALAKHPADRHRSAGELLADLRRVVT